MSDLDRRLLMKAVPTKVFEKWLDKLDMTIQVVVLKYIKRLEDGNFSNSKHLRKGIHELKIDFQKGYRVYFVNAEQNIVLLLCGGHKTTQDKDIKKALELKESL
jgi:putative addiction module killer protein